MTEKRRANQLREQKKKTVAALKAAGLPVPPDLKKEVEGK